MGEKQQIFECVIDMGAERVVRDPAQGTWRGCVPWPMQVDGGDDSRWAVQIMGDRV
jgi:hypothetical protein